MSWKSFDLDPRCDLEYFCTLNFFATSVLIPFNIEKVKVSYEENNRLAWFGAKPSFPTIEIAQYDTDKKRKVRGGMKFKTKWR